MPCVAIANHHPKRVLTARSAVDAIAPGILHLIADDSNSIALDFENVVILSPSAIDQLLVRLEAASGGRDVQFTNMPFPPSRVHEAIARAHGRTLIESGPNSWTFAVR